MLFCNVPGCVDEARCMVLLAYAEPSKTMLCDGHARHVRVILAALLHDTAADLR